MHAAAIELPVGRGGGEFKQQSAVRELTVRSGNQSWAAAARHKASSPNPARANTLKSFLERGN